jgi:hypothetical protein
MAVGLAKQVYNLQQIAPTAKSRKYKRERKWKEVGQKIANGAQGTNGPRHRKGIVELNTLPVPQLPRKPRTPRE